MSDLQPGKYRHYKGNMYEVLFTAQHSETGEMLVIYRANYGEYGTWARPLEMFTENVVVDGIEQPRFALVD